MAEKETHVQDQGGFEGRRRQVHQDGFEGRYKQAPPMIKEAKPEERPPEQRPPAGEPTYTELVKRLLDSEARIIEELVAIREGLKTAEKFEVNYYNTPLTAIAVATPDPPAGSPLDPNQIAGLTGYQVEGIYTQLQRIAPKITVINDGTSNLFVITTPDGTNWSREAPILTGEARTFFNVWELRLRSPVAGNLTLLTGGIYRVTEYEFWLAYSSNVNKASFDARVVNAPVAGALLSTQLGATIQVPNGFALVLRATVGNAGQVYVANSVANAVAAGVPGNRITLNAGDSARLYIKNTDAVAIAGSALAQNLDVLVEQ